MAQGPSGQAARSWGSPGPAAPPGPSAAPSYRQRHKPTHTRPRGPAVHTHTCTRVCMHKLISFPSPRRLLRPRRSLIPFIRASIITPRLCRMAAAPRQGKRWTRAGGSGCRTARVSARAPSRLARETGETPKEPRPRATSHHRNTTRRCRGAGAGEAAQPARMRLSSDPPPRGNRPETRVNRKAKKKSPGEGDLPVGGRGRLEDRGESEEACLSWRQGGSPS